MHENALFVNSRASLQFKKSNLLSVAGRLNCFKNDAVIWKSLKNLYLKFYVQNTKPWRKFWHDSSKNLRFKL